MDRINAVYIYDGKDTWTDESGAEWNKAVNKKMQECERIKTWLQVKNIYNLY